MSEPKPSSKASKISKMAEPETDPWGSVWRIQGDALREFVDNRPKYESLSKEVAYILQKRLELKKIRVAAVTSRAKSIRSFCEKVMRKSYDSPMTEITDLAGVRIVYLYRSNRSAIEELVEREFNVLEKVDKTEQLESDHFGYGALHYLVQLGDTSTGARYDDLKELVCEIQVRTVLQDAWAIIAHHLSYKQESAVPKALRRKLNSLMGLFETADDQFDRLRDEREAYIAKIGADLSEEQQHFRQEINLDLLIEYLKEKFPMRDKFEEEHASELLIELQNVGYSTLAKLDKALNRSSAAFLAYEKKYPPTKLSRGVSVHPGYNPIGCVRGSLSIADEAFLESRKPTDTFRSQVEEFHGMLKQ